MLRRGDEEKEWTMVDEAKVDIVRRECRDGQRTCSSGKQRKHFSGVVRGSGSGRAKIGVLETADWGISSRSKLASPIGSLGNIGAYGGKTQGK
jgi:hypothetical protein